MAQEQLGILELTGKTGRTGRLRILDKTLISTPADPVVDPQIVDRYDLRPGLKLKVLLGKPVGGGGGQSNKQKKKSKYKKGRKKSQNVQQTPNAPNVTAVLEIEDQEAESYKQERRFENLTTVDPKPRLTLEYPGCPPACRLIDMFCPIGYGQRGLIVSPPKAGKTILLQQIAFSIKHNHPGVEVIALLIDERPEEVTDFRRNVPCTVLASSNDHTPEKHVALAALAVERAKRHAEAGKDIVVLLDSLTRMGRAFNVAPGMANTGRTLSGGLDAGALSIPKQLFGAARRFEEGGSLTILATALVDTGSRGDQVIFEEFKGTGNMEMILDRKIAERRLWPAIDLAASGTRKEHLLLEEHELQTVTALRRRLMNMPPHMQIEQLLRALDRYETNAELVGSPQSPANA